MKIPEKYSMGIGDRFGHQGEAQLKAIMKAAEKGIAITPVWNKSNREHIITGTRPSDVRKEADEVTKNAGFSKKYFVDADHINADTVETFIEYSDFFTIDVASHIGKKAGTGEINEFLKSAEKYTGNLKIPGLKKTFEITKPILTGIAEKYLFAAIKAYDTYRKIEKQKGSGNFITEVSMDETSQPQTPVELFFILSMLASENIPVQTIAPKFSGRFNKGIDYIGDPSKFAEEFEDDLLVIDYAVREFGLPADLRISVHSGSDKFAIYPYIGSLIRKYEKGIHIKTAGTTWLEEVIGLAESGGEALQFVKEIYTGALDNIVELCAPYADVTDIKISSLPPATEIMKWDSARFAATIRHDSRNRFYNPGARQLIHVAYKLAAVRKEEYYGLLDKYRDVISECVCSNIYDRHICRLFDIR